MAELYLIYLFIAETGKSGLIVRKTCAALSPANVNKLVCLNNWLGL